MKDIILQAVLFYAIAAIIVGLIFASFEQVTVRRKGIPLRYPRLIGGIMAGLFWPVVFWQIIFRPIR